MIARSESSRRNLCRVPPAKRRSRHESASDDIQAALPARDRERVEREGGLIARADYEKYISEVTKRES
jgi:hypothetical protein